MKNLNRNQRVFLFSLFLMVSTGSFVASASDIPSSEKHTILRAGWTGCTCIGAIANVEIKAVTDIEDMKCNSLADNCFGYHRFVPGDVACNGGNAVSPENADSNEYIDNSFDVDIPGTGTWTLCVQFNKWNAEGTGITHLQSELPQRRAVFNLRNGRCSVIRCESAR